MADTLHRVHGTLAQMQKNLECSICLELLRDPVLTKCDHHFCNFCILALLQSKRRPSAPCPLCKEPVTKRGLIKHESLKKIVDAYRSIVTAVEDDTGRICTPPRGPIRLSQPEPASQRPKPPPKNDGKKSNVRRGRKKGLPAIPIHLDPEDGGETVENVGKTNTYNVNVRSAFPSSKANTKDPGIPDPPTNSGNIGESLDKAVPSDAFNGPDILDALAEESLGFARPCLNEQYQRDSSDRALTEKPVTENNIPSPSDPYEFIASQKTPKKVKKRAAKAKKKKPWEYSFGKISRKEKKKEVEDRENQTQDDWQSDEDEDEDSSLVHREDIVDQEERHGDQSRIADDARNHDGGRNVPNGQEAGGVVVLDSPEDKIARSVVSVGNRVDIEGRRDESTVQNPDNGTMRRNRQPPDQRVESSDDEDFAEDLDFDDDQNGDEYGHLNDGPSSDRHGVGRRGERRKSASKALEAIKDQHSSQSSGEVVNDSPGQSLSNFTPVGRVKDNQLPLFGETQEVRPCRRGKEPLNVKQRPYYNPANADQDEVPLSQPPVLNRNHGDKLFAKTYGKGRMKSPPSASKRLESRRVDPGNDLPDLMSIENEEDEHQEDGNEGCSERGDSQEVSLEDIGLAEMGDGIDVRGEDDGISRKEDMQETGEEVLGLPGMEDGNVDGGIGSVASERQSTPQEDAVQVSHDEEDVVDLTLDEEDEQEMQGRDPELGVSSANGIVKRNVKEPRTVEDHKSSSVGNGRTGPRDDNATDSVLPQAAPIDKQEANSSGVGNGRTRDSDANAPDDDVLPQAPVKQHKTNDRQQERIPTRKERMRNEDGLVASDESDEVGRNQQEEKDWELAMKLAAELGSVPPELEVRSLRGRKGKEAENSSKDRGRKGRKAKQLRIENGPEPSERRVKRTRGRGGLRAPERDQEEMVAIDSFKDDSGRVAGSTEDINGGDGKVEKRVRKTRAGGREQNAAKEQDDEMRKESGGVIQGGNQEAIPADDVMDETEDGRGRTKSRKANGRGTGTNEGTKSGENTGSCRMVGGSRVTWREDQGLVDHLMSNTKEGTDGRRIQRKKRSGGGQNGTGKDSSRAEVSSLNGKPSGGNRQEDVRKDTLVGNTDGIVNHVENCSDEGRRETRRTRSSGRKKPDVDISVMSRRTRSSEHIRAENDPKSGVMVIATGDDKMWKAAPAENETPDDMVRCVPETPYIGAISVECGLDISKAERVDRGANKDENEIPDEDEEERGGIGRREGRKSKNAVGVELETPHPDSREEVVKSPRVDADVEEGMEVPVVEGEGSRKSGKKQRSRESKSTNDRNISPGPIDVDLIRDEDMDEVAQRRKGRVGGRKNVKTPGDTDDTRKVLRKSSRLSKEKSTSSTGKVDEDLNNMLAKKTSKGRGQGEGQRRFPQSSRTREVAEEMMKDHEIVSETVTGASKVSDSAHLYDVESDGMAEELQLAANMEEGERDQLTCSADTEDVALVVSDEGRVKIGEDARADNIELAVADHEGSSAAERRPRRDWQGADGKKGKTTRSQDPRTATNKNPTAMSEVTSEDESNHDEDADRSGPQPLEKRASGGQKRLTRGRQTRSSRSQDGGKPLEAQNVFEEDFGDGGVILVNHDEQNAEKGDNVGNEHGKMQSSNVPPPLVPGQKGSGRLSRSPRGSRSSNDGRGRRKQASNSDDGLHPPGQERTPGRLTRQRGSSQSSKSPEEANSGGYGRGKSDRRTTNLMSSNGVDAEVALFSEVVQEGCDNNQEDESTKRDKTTQKMTPSGCRGAVSGSSTESIQLADSSPIYAESDVLEAPDRKELSKRGVLETAPTGENTPSRQRRDRTERNAGTDKTASKPTRSLRSRGKKEEERETDSKITEQELYASDHGGRAEEKSGGLRKETLEGELAENGRDKSGSSHEGQIQRPSGKEQIEGRVDGTNKDHENMTPDVRRGTESVELEKGENRNGEIDEGVQSPLGKGSKQGGLAKPSALESDDHSAPDIFTMHLEGKEGSGAPVGKGKTVSLEDGEDVCKGIGNGVGKGSKLSLKKGKERKKRKRKTFAFGNDVQLDDLEVIEVSSEVGGGKAPHGIEVPANSDRKDRDDNLEKLARSAEEARSKVFHSTGGSLDRSEPFAPATIGASEPLGAEETTLLPGHRSGRLEKGRVNAQHEEELLGFVVESKSADVEVLQATGETDDSEHVIPATVGASESLGDEDGSLLPGHRPTRRGKKARPSEEMSCVSEDFQGSCEPTPTRRTSQKGRGKRKPAESGEVLEKPSKRSCQSLQDREVSGLEVENEDDDECSMVPPSQPSVPVAKRSRNKSKVDEMGDDSHRMGRHKDGDSKVGEEGALSMVETFTRLEGTDLKSSAASQKRVGEDASMSLGTPSISLLQDVEFVDDEANLESAGEPRGEPAAKITPENNQDEEVEVSDDDDNDGRDLKATMARRMNRRADKTENRGDQIRVASKDGLKVGAEEGPDVGVQLGEGGVMRDNGVGVTAGNEADVSGGDGSGREEGNEEVEDSDGGMQPNAPKVDGAPKIVKGMNDDEDSDVRDVVVDDKDRDAKAANPDKEDRDSKLDDVYDAEYGEEPLFDDDSVSQSSVSSRHNLTSASSVLSSQSDLMNSQQQENAKETLRKMKQEIAEMERALAEEAGLDGARVTAAEDTSDESDLEDVGLELTGRSGDKDPMKSEGDQRKASRSSGERGRSMPERGLGDDGRGRINDVVVVEELETDVGSWLEGGKYGYSNEKRNNVEGSSGRDLDASDDGDRSPATDGKAKQGRRKSGEEDLEKMADRVHTGEDGGEGDAAGNIVVIDCDDDNESEVPVCKNSRRSVDGRSLGSGSVSQATEVTGLRSGGMRTPVGRGRSGNGGRQSGSGKKRQSDGSSAGSDARSNTSGPRRHSSHGRSSRGSLTKYGKIGNVDDIEDAEVAENVKDSVSEMAAAEESLNSIMKTLAARRREDEIAQRGKESEKRISQGASGVEREGTTPPLVEVGISPSSPRSPSPPPVISQRTLLRRVSPVQVEIAKAEKVKRISVGSGACDEQPIPSPRERNGIVERNKKLTGGSVIGGMSSSSQKKRRRVVVDESSSEDEAAGSANPTKVPKLDSPEPKVAPAPMECDVGPGREAHGENGTREEKQVQLTVGVNKVPARAVNEVARSSEGEKGRDQTQSTLSAIQGGSTGGGSRDGHRRNKPRKGESMSLITTGLNKQKLKLVDQLCRKAGCRFSSAFSSDTTHVIVNADEDLTCERTLKYFQGIAARRWIISYQWVQDSLSSSRLLPQDKYEVRGDTVNGRNHCGPRRARMWKNPPLLSDYSFYCLEPYTGLTKDQLCGLLSSSGGTVVDHPSSLLHEEGRENVIVAQADALDTPPDYNALYQKFGVPVISREWVLDSIAVYTAQPINDYLLCDVTEEEEMEALDSGDEF